MSRDCLWYSMWENIGLQRGNRGWNLYNVMNSWARQRAPSSSLHCCVWFSPFLPPCNMLKRAVSLVITGDQSEVPNHLQWGFSFCTALYWDGPAWLWWLQHKEEGVNFRERQTHQKEPFCFSIYFSQLCVNTNDMLCAISHIFMTSCGAVVKSFPLSHKKWGRSITL